MEKSKKLPIDKKSTPTQSFSKISNQDISLKKKTLTMPSSYVPKVGKTPSNTPHKESQSDSHFEVLDSLKKLEEALVVRFSQLSQLMTEPQRDIFEILKKDIFEYLDHHRHATHEHTKYLKKINKVSSSQPKK